VVFEAAFITVSSLRIHAVNAPRANTFQARTFNLENPMQFLPHLVGLVFIFVGIRTLLTRQARLTIQLWGDPEDTPSNRRSAVYSSSEHSGFIAILIGLVEVAAGAGLLFKGSAFFG